MESSIDDHRFHRFRVSGHADHVVFVTLEVPIATGLEVGIHFDSPSSRWPNLRLDPTEQFYSRHPRQLGNIHIVVNSALAKNRIG